MGQVPEGMHYRKGDRRKDGTRVRSTYVRNRGRRPKATQEVPPPSSSSRRAKVALTVGLVATATIGGAAVTASLNRSASGGNTLNVQVKVDVTHAISALAVLGFRDITQTKHYNDPHCAAAASGDVQQFLFRHPCKEYTSVIMTNSSRGTTTRVAVTWVVMPDPKFAGQYMALEDVYGSGNPPGQPPLQFDGHCQASGGKDATVWVEQVEPTGHVNADREILRAAAPVKLTPADLRHCDR